VADDSAVCGDDQCLRDYVAPVHQGARRIIIGPADAEFEIEIPDKLLYATSSGDWIFGGQSNEFNSAISELLAHSLIIGHLTAAWPTPRRPKIHHDYFSGEVGKPERALIQRFELTVE